MGDTNFRGPINSMGSLEAEYTSAYTTASLEPFDGPSGFYQGIGLLDPRGYPFQSEGMLPGRVPGFLDNVSLWAVDNIPQAAASNVIASAQISTANIPIALITAQVAGATTGVPSVAVGIPIIPQGTSNVVTAAFALDFGFITGTTVANSSTVNVSDNTKLQVGQWVLIGGAGGGNNSSLFTQVQSIATSNYTNITIAPVAPAALSNAPIGGSNLFGAGLLPPGTQFGPSSVVPTAHDPRILAGLQKVHNPVEALARNISISQVTAAAAATATQFLVSGWDFWRQPMTELITMSAGSTAGTTAFGKKAFKYIASIVPTGNVNTGNSYAVGIGDVFGVPFRADHWEQTNQMAWAGTAAANSVGFTAAATTSPATNTTGDVRGTFQLSANGAGSAITGTLASNNTSRLAIVQDVGVWNILNATPNSTISLFGVANSTT